MAYQWNIIPIILKKKELKDKQGRDICCLGPFY